MATTLPMDIIFSCILPKLPAKSLCRFKCVSESFLAEISSRKFTELQHHYTLLSPQANRLLILPSDHGSMCIYDLDLLDSPPLICPYPKPVTFTGICMTVVASCECYLLLASRYTHLEDLILLNPTTRTYRELPTNTVPSTSEEPIYGVCHCLDEYIDDYKVIRVRDFTARYESYENHREIMVYSMRTNMWKLIESKPSVEKIPSWIYGNGVLVQDHLFHLVFVHESDYDARVTRIGCFDMKAEQWCDDVLLPDVHLDGIGPNFIMDDSHVDLRVLDEQLCFLMEDKNESAYNLWVMKEYGVKESWVKLMSLSLSSNEAERDWHALYHPIAYRKGSPHVLLCEHPRSSTSFFWYNLRDNEAIETEINNLPSSYQYSTTYICKGSLLNFPGGQTISLLSSSSEDGDDEEVEDDEDNRDFIGCTASEDLAIEQWPTTNHE